MSIPLNINGTDYFYPETGDVSWGPDATDWAVAVTSGMLQKAGGLFQLLADVDFGPNYGLKSAYYLSRTANPATAGSLRLARTDVISWRNQANSANLDLSVDASDQLLFNGSPIGVFQSVSDTDSIDLTLTGSDLSADLKLSSASATMGSFKATLSIESDGLLAQATFATASLSGFLSSTDWNTFNNKQNALPSFANTRVLFGDGTSTPSTSADLTFSSKSLTIGNSNGASYLNFGGSQPTDTGYVFGNNHLSIESVRNTDILTSGNPSGNTGSLSLTTGNSSNNSGSITLQIGTAGGTRGKIILKDGSEGTAGHVWTSTNTTGSGGWAAPAVTGINQLTGDVTAGPGTGSQAATIAASAVTLAKMANLAANSIIGNNTGSPATPLALTATQVTAMLDVFVGSSLTSNVKGLVPAPASDDSDDAKFLRGDGTWSAIPAANTFDDTDSIDLTDTAGTITADLNLSAASPDSGNINAISSIETDGLQVQVPIMIGDTGLGGSAGVVPAPAMGDATKFLRGDGTWQTAGGASAIAFAFGSGSDGDVTVTSPISLSRDMFYNNLTISGSGAITTAGYKIFVKGVLDLTAAAAGAIKFVANNGTDNSTGSSLAQAGGATINPQTVGGSSAGGAGGAGGTGGNGATGAAGTTGIQGSGSGAGGKGGNGGSSNGGAQGAGTANSTFFDNFTRYATDLLRGVTLLTGGCGGRGGSGAGLGSGGNGAGGPGGGGGGGVVFISAFQVLTSGAAGSAISALGGNGGTITFGSTGGTTGGAGGGGGGGGGWVYLCYGQKLDAAATDLIDVSGGSGGAGGNSVAANGGDSGGGGGGGRVTIFCIADGTGSSTFGGNAVAPNAASSGTGGSTQPGESIKVSF